MKDYSCNKCGKTFKQKCHYTYHINRKIPCTTACSQTLINAENNQIPPSQSLKNLTTIETEKEESPFFKCRFCLREFSRRDNMKRHEEIYCKNKDAPIEQTNLIEKIEKLETVNEELKTANEKLHNELITIKSSLSNIKEPSIINNTTNNTQNNINIIVNNNINMVDFGREQLSMLNEKEKMEILTAGNNAIVRHIQNVHFNKRLPELMNIYRTNMRDNKCHTYENGKWYQTDLNFAIELLIEYGMTDIDDIIEEFPDKSGFSIKNTKDLVHFLKNNNKKMMKEQKTKVGTILYNEREKSIGNKKTAGI